MKKLLFIFTFLFCAMASAQTTVDALDFQGKVSTVIRDAYDVPTGHVYMIWHNEAGQFEYAEDDDVWLSFGGINWSTPVNADVIPDGPETRDLGSTANPFDDIYFGGQIRGNGDGASQGYISVTEAGMYIQSSDDTNTLAITNRDGIDTGGRIGIRPFSNWDSGVLEYDWLTDGRWEIQESPVLTGANFAGFGLEVNDLTTAVVWANVPDINIPNAFLHDGSRAISGAVDFDENNLFDVETMTAEGIELHDETETNIMAILTKGITGGGDFSFEPPTNPVTGNMYYVISLNKWFIGGNEIATQPGAGSSNLSDYLLLDGSAPMTGGLDLDGNNITMGGAHLNLEGGEIQNGGEASFTVVGGSTGLFVPSGATGQNGIGSLFVDTDDDGLYFHDGTTFRLLSTSGGGGASELSDLSDVNTSTPTNRNALLGDGVDWESRPIIEADISDLAHTSQNIDDAEETGTTYTPTTSDLYKLKEMNNAATITVSEPTGSYSDGENMSFQQTGAGVIEFDFEDWVTGEFLRTTGTGDTYQLRYKSVSRNSSNWAFMGAGESYTAGNSIEVTSPDYYAAAPSIVSADTNEGTEITEWSNIVAATPDAVAGVTPEIHVDASNSNVQVSFVEANGDWLNLGQTHQYTIGDYGYVIIRVGEQHDEGGSYFSQAGATASTDRPFWLFTQSALWRIYVGHTGSLPATGAEANVGPRQLVIVNLKGTVFDMWIDGVAGFTDEPVGSNDFTADINIGSRTNGSYLLNGDIDIVAYKFGVSGDELTQAEIDAIEAEFQINALYWVIFLALGQLRRRKYNLTA